MSNAGRGIGIDIIEIARIRKSATNPRFLSRVFGEKELEVPALSSLWLDEIDFQTTDFLRNHFSYELLEEGEAVSGGSVLFTSPKYHRFADPELRAAVEGDRGIVAAGAYAKSVEILPEDGELVLSDNYFDMEKGERKLRILERSGDFSGRVRVRSVFDIR